jgi:hypothetical protein
MHPQPRVRKKAHERSHHGHTGFTRHSLRNGFTAYSVLSPATNSSCHRHQQIKVCLSPVGPTRLRKFNTSNGCQDHTALPSAHAPFVSAPLIAHRPMRTRPAITSRAQRCRVHRIPPRVRDDRDTPLEWDETARVIDLIWVWREQKSFCKQDWTASIRLIRFNKLNGTPHGRLRQTGPRKARPMPSSGLRRFARHAIASPSWRLHRAPNAAASTATIANAHSGGRNARDYIPRCDSFNRGAEIRGFVAE